MIDPRWPGDRSAPDMMRDVAERLGDLNEDSAEQVLYLSRVLPFIIERNHDDLMNTSTVALGRAAAWLDDL